MTQVEKANLKITWIKAGSVLIAGASISLTLGVYLGDWLAWRHTTDQRIDKVEKWKDGFESHNISSDYSLKTTRKNGK